MRQNRLILRCVVMSRGGLAMAGSRTGLVVRRFDCAIDSSSVSSPMILIRIQTKPSRMLILGYLRCKHVLLWYVMPSAVERYVVEFEYESLQVVELSCVSVDQSNRRPRYRDKLTTCNRPRANYFIICALGTSVTLITSFVIFLRALSSEKY